MKGNLKFITAPQLRLRGFNLQTKLTEIRMTEQRRNPLQGITNTTSLVFSSFSFVPIRSRSSAIARVKEEKNLKLSPFTSPILTHKTIANPSSIKKVFFTGFNVSPKWEIRTFANESKDDDDEPKPKNMKELIKRYGSIGFIFYWSLSLTTFSSLYLAISWGVDISSIFQSLGFELNQKASTAGTFAVAFLANKLLVPIKLAITMGATPFIARWWKKRQIAQEENKH